MQYAFPNVQRKCLLCGEAGCARWKGYFVRRVLCGQSGYVGLVAIHVGHCRSLERDFSYFPDFLLPGRRVSRFTLARFAAQYKQNGNIKSCIDDVIDQLGAEDFTLALSSAYEWLYASVRALRLNAGFLAIAVGVVTSVLVLKSVLLSALEDLFLHSRLSWHPSQHMIFYPP